MKQAMFFLAAGLLTCCGVAAFPLEICGQTQPPVVSTPRQPNRPADIPNVVPKVPSNAIPVQPGAIPPPAPTPVLPPSVGESPAPIRYTVLMRHCQYEPWQGRPAFYELVHVAYKVANRLHCQGYQARVISVPPPPREYHLLVRRSPYEPWNKRRSFFIERCEAERSAQTLRCRGWAVQIVCLRN